MRRLILGWKKLGWQERLQARIINYADDFVMLCRGQASVAQGAMQELMKRLKLTVNERKTRICRVAQESLEVLGYTIGRCYRAGSGQPYIGTRPAKKRVQRICAAVSAATERHWLGRTAEETVEGLNRQLRGWGNYFCLGSVSKAYRAVHAHTRKRLRQWLCAKHKVRSGCTKRFPDEMLYGKLGLVRLSHTTKGLPWANA